MFGKKCWNCGKRVHDDWRYCPYCGVELQASKRQYSRIIRLPTFDSLIEEIEREFERFDRLFKFPELSETGFRSGGISITIHTSNEGRPKIEVKTFGDYKKFEPQIRKRLGVTHKPELKEVSTEVIKRPRISEEPEAEVEKEDGIRKIRIKLPDVKNERDIDVKRLEQSVEVRAYAGDKVYFKLIPINPNESILRKEFKDGVLTLELG